MLSHIHIGIGDLARGLAFYGPLLESLGWRLKFADEGQGWAGWRPAEAERPLLLIGRPFDGRPAEAGNGQMVALLAPDRPAVDRFHALALSMGGVDEGAPGLRPQYHPDYYGAYVRDPFGNKLCACCHDPA